MTYYSFNYLKIIERLIFMKKYVPVIFFLLCILCMVSCGEDSSSPSSSVAKKESTVFVYDEGANLNCELSFKQDTENSIDVTRFAKQGYKFEGIYDMARGIMLFDASGNQSPTVMLDADFTAILKYTPITYQLIFDAENGDLEDDTQYIKMISYEEPMSLFPKPVLQGMTFDGWFDEDGNRFSEGTSPIDPIFTSENYPISGETIKLHAKYKVLICNVRLMLQDGTKDIQLQIPYGEKLPDLSQYYKDDGKRAVMGFGVSNSSTECFDEVIYTDLDLYALWREYKYINFVYTSTETKTIKVYREGDMAILPDGVMPGYEFEGWYSSSLLSGNKISKVAFNGMAETYYGKWSVGKYTIQFVAEDKLIKTIPFDIYNFNITTPQVPYKKNYVGHWEEFELDFKNMIINAIYEPVEIKITLVNGADYKYHTIKYGETYSLYVPSKTGYNFIGWYYKGEKLTDESGKALSSYIFDKPITVTAGWEPKECKLHFETNGGSAVESVTLKYGERYVITQEAERGGFYFTGWYDESMTDEYHDGITITEDTVVYAKWIKSKAISTVKELKEIANNPIGNYHLTQDIDLKGGDWEPIENFTGILDGNGYKIHNFSLRQKNKDLSFIIKNEGIIKNIAFSNVDISSTIDGTADYAVGTVCAYNAGRVFNVSVEKITMLVNISSYNVNQTVRVGGLVGENTGRILSCKVQADIMSKNSLDLYGYNIHRSTTLFLGGLVGKDTSIIRDVHTDVFFDINEYVHTDCYIGDCYEYFYLNVGGVSGGEYGNMTDCDAKLVCQIYSNAAGDSQSLRYNRIGGITGCSFENSLVSECYSEGEVAFKRIGLRSNSAEMAVGGVVGKVESGTVNNCDSAMNVTLKEGYGGTIGGVAGIITINGKVTNVAYYGNIKTESFSGGYFAGLAGSVAGWLSKGYFNGNIVSDSKQCSDVVGLIDTSGSVSKMIGNGKTRCVFTTNKGSSLYNYIIGVDYDKSVLYDREMLFDTLELFESDFWSIDEEKGLYLVFSEDR